MAARLLRPPVQFLSAVDARRRAGWALLLCTSVVYFLSGNAADNDLWGHVMFGRAILAAGAVPGVDAYAYTTAGHPWINHEWLSQVVLAAVYGWAGSPGLIVLKLAVGAGTIACVLAVVCARSTVPYVWGGVGILAVAVVARGFAFRPQIFTYLGIAALLALLDRYRRGQARVLWIVPALFLLWANLHGGFALGLAILAWFAVAEFARAPARSGPCLAAAAVAAAATLLTPNGVRLLPYVWNELSRSHPITEWQPVAAGDVAQLAFFVMAALFVLTLPLARQWRARGWEVLLAAGMLVLAFRHQRHTAVFAVVAAAPLAAQLDALLGRIQGPRLALSAASHRLVGVAVLALACTQVVLCATRWRHDGLQIVFDPREYPTGAVAALRRAGVQANLAVPLEWGEYALWFLAPRVKVSIDGRFATLFPEQVVRDNFDFFGGAPGWRRLLERYPTDAALVPVGSACPVTRLPGWRRVYGDAVAEVYVHSDAIGLLPADGRPAPARGVFP